MRADRFTLAGDTRTRSEKHVFQVRNMSGKPIAREWSAKEIQSFVRDLESLQGGGFAAAALVGCGERAIGPLRSFLLDGQPRGIFQPRQLAVETLAELGAKDILIEYLLQSRKIEDSAIRFGEDAVLSTAARELGRWKTEDVYEALKKISNDRLLTGIVESLGAFARQDSISYFLWALGDGICRQAAEDALHKIGETARPRLLEAARNPNPSAEDEGPSSLQRRRKVLQILAELLPSITDWEALRPLLDENDAEIVVATARMGLKICPPNDRQFAIQRVIEALPSADSFVQTEARKCLAENFSIAQPQVDAEIARRCTASHKERGLDVVLRLLVNLEAAMCKERTKTDARPHE